MAGGLRWLAGRGVLLGLATGAQHGVIPSDRPAAGHAFARWRQGADFAQGRGRNRGRALFRFTHEAITPIEVNAAGTGGAVTVVEGHGAFKDISIGSIVWRGRVRSRHTQNVAQFGEKDLVIGTFRRARLLPAGDEGGGIGEVGYGGCVGVHGGK